MLDRFLDRLRSLGRGKRRCPVCEHPVRGFLPLPVTFKVAAELHGFPHFGKGETINVAEYACPSCGASDRERLYALFLDETVCSASFVSASKLLHFAPETALSARIRRLGLFDYRTADLSMEGVDDRLDITDMATYRNEEFDCFICSHVLEHVPDDQQALRELRRILKAGGWGILMAPVMPHLEQTLEDTGASTDAERWKMFGQGDHLRLYGKGDFLNRIRGAGFNVMGLGAAHFGAAHLHRCGITIDSMLYVVNRPHD